MKKQFMVERQGNTFVLYAGLLDEAHEQGLKSIRTTLLQIPSDENGRTAICQATVETERGTFMGIGDAAPNNVPSPMLGCIIRLAETRAKARALRDAVNVGVAALEELGEADESNVAGATHVYGGHSRPSSVAEHFRPTERFASESKANGGAARPAESALATPAQVHTIYLIGRDQRGLNNAQVEEQCQAQYSCAPAALTKRQASEFITALKTNNKPEPALER